MLVFDVALSRDDRDTITTWDRMPGFDPVAVARGTLSGDYIVDGKWRLDLDLGPDAGVTSGGTDRLLLIEMRRRKVPAGVGPEQPTLGPSTFYAADINHTAPLLPAEDPSILWSHDVLGLRQPQGVRPDAEVPVVRILTHRPPRRGARPNPDPAAGSN